MSLKSRLQPVLALVWPTDFQVRVEIDPMRVARPDTVGIVGLRLFKMGGKLVEWRPDFNQQPAVARFEFSHSAARDAFIAEAIGIPGVSIAARRVSAAPKPGFGA